MCRFQVSEGERGEEMGDVKFAVVRVQGEQRMIDLFTLLVSQIA